MAATRVLPQGLEPRSRVSVDRNMDGVLTNDSL